MPQRILVVPAACYLAISLACLVLFFPQTLHSVVLNSTIKACFVPSLSQLELQDDVLSAKSEDHERWSQLAVQAYALRGAQMSGVAALDGKMKMLELEVSRGRFGPADLANIYGKSKELSVRAYGLSCMIVSHSGWYYSTRMQLMSTSMVTDEEHWSTNRDTDEPQSGPCHSGEQHMKLPHGSRLPNTSLDDLLPIVAASSQPLRSAAKTALQAAIEWLGEVNKTRWRKPKSSSPGITSRQTNLAQLRVELEQFRESSNLALLEPFLECFDEAGTLKPELEEVCVYSARGLCRCFVFTTSMISFASVLAELLELLLDIETCNPRTKLHVPTRFVGSLVRTANDRTGGGNPLDMGVKDPLKIEASNADDGDSDDAEKDVDVEKTGHWRKHKTEQGSVWGGFVSLRIKMQTGTAVRIR